MLIKFPDLASKRSKDNTPAGQIADRPVRAPELLSSKGDPIFAAIDALRRAHAEFLSSKGQEQLDENWEIVEEAALVLIGVEPTSVAGAIALLSYFAECTAKDTELPDHLSDNDDPAVSDLALGARDGVPYSYFIARNVAQALSRLTVLAP
jgi:hypothetical protein